MHKSLLPFVSIKVNPKVFVLYESPLPLFNTTIIPKIIFVSIFSIVDYYFEAKDIQIVIDLFLAETRRTTIYRGIEVLYLPPTRKILYLGEFVAGSRCLILTP